jgi:hypothetical protein
MNPFFFLFDDRGMKSGRGAIFVLWDGRRVVTTEGKEGLGRCRAMILDARACKVVDVPLKSWPQ